MLTADRDVWDLGGYYPFWGLDGRLLMLRFKGDCRNDSAAVGLRRIDGSRCRLIEGLYNNFNNIRVRIFVLTGVPFLNRFTNFFVGLPFCANILRA